MAKKTDVESDEQRMARRRGYVAGYEKANDIVPGTAWCKGDDPEGGQSWEGRARMAAARLATGHDLDIIDHEALGRSEARQRSA